MKVLQDINEFKRFVKVNNIVLIGFVEGNTDVKRYMINLFEKLESRIGHIINFALFDIENTPNNSTIKEDEGINKLPLIRLYLNGKNVFEQEDCFMDLRLDYYVLKISMKDILQRHGIRWSLRPTI